MMKWRRKSIHTPPKDCVDGSKKEQMLSRSYNESEILASFSSDSPFEDLMLEDIYNRFSTQNKKVDDDTTNDAFVVQTAKNRYHIRHKSDRRISPASLPSIEECIESDELASIADSGICDDDYDLDLDNNNKYNKNKSYFAPLKNEDDEEFLKLHESEDDLLSCITDELHKRNESDEDGKLVKNTGLSDVFISGLNKIEDDNNKYITCQKLQNNKKVSKIERRRRAFSSDMVLNLKNESNFMTSLPKIESKSLEDLRSCVETEIDIDSSVATENSKIEIDSLDLPLLTSTPNNDHVTGGSIDSRNKQIFSRLKLKADLHKSTIQGLSNNNNNNNHKIENDKEDLDLPSSLMSSMLWNGQTSTRPPSTSDIYQTMPPNKYPKRKNDFMTQLTSCPEEDKTTREFKVNLDVHHYAPEEILVTLEDGKLVVNGKHFSESEYGFESCQFHRRYPIPDGIKTTDIKSTINEEGVLSIVGRVGPPAVKPKPKVKDERFSHYDNVDRDLNNSPFNNVPHNNSSLYQNTSNIFQSSNTHQVNTQAPNKAPPITPRNLSLNTEQAIIQKSPDTPRVSPDGSPASQTKMNFHENRSKPAKIISENEFNEIDETTYLLKVNCASYTPDDMEVRVTGRELIVRGRQKVSQLEDGQEKIRHKEFTKRFSIPRLADCNTITSKFTDNDLLFVEVKKSKK